MTADLHALAKAISATGSPNVRNFALAVADILQPVAPPPDVGTQGYSVAEITALRTAGNIVAPKSYSATFLSPTAARFEVRSGDQYLGWSGERAQIQLPQTAYQGHEGQAYHWHFGFALDPAFKLPPEFVAGQGDYLVLWEHHHTGSTGSPPSTLQIKGTNLVWTQVKSPDPAKSWDWTPTVLAPAVPGNTYTVDVSCVLSTDPAKAQTAVFVNGRQVAISGPNLLTGMNIYPMWGLYRAPSPLTQVVTFGPVSRYA